MQFAWMNASSATHASIQDAEDAAAALFRTNATAVSNGATLAPNTFYALQFDDGAPLTIFRMAPPTDTTHVVAFMQHNPKEFEGKYHWLLDADGGAIEAGAVEPAAVAAEPADNDATSYLASFIASAVSLVGVMCAGPTITRLMGGVERFRTTASAFASGALLFCACALIFPEGLHKLAANGAKESLVNAWFAVSVSSGVALCIALDSVMRKPAAPDAAVTAASGTVANVGGSEAAVVPVDGIAAAIATASPSPHTFFDTALLSPLVVQVVMGDFFHNFVDGIIIGSAFKSCSTSAGWAVTAGTVYHELSQEIADFLVLVTQGKMRFGQAVAANFISSLGCIIGTIVINATNPSSPWVGGLMCFGGGIYGFIALSQLQWWSDGTDMLRNAIFFFIGCLGIGLVLISHEHCTPTTTANAATDDPHAGHNH